MAMTAARKQSIEVPHSWDLKSWPQIWPNDGKRAKWVLRAYRNELVAEGALSRAGKTIIVLGKGYSRWLSKRTSHVHSFQSNNPEIRRSGTA
jgi:hypothetical protein